ncbi:hypothetical protein SARC_09013 [Sphaeroforma arctica JP610]|uniref:ABC transporter domain-containing protein n=1 Tax=Sphaeroforma arctica JP610 TaxID=667725 RepID=A0A0L0FPZ5_9EUKA|nr:hypothetical protein SARC_09013 [Sphaeroforma arctica JP610]KNC78566.1 hypothetical protein SARC_09013 [Sphaeroforma arctica JP610]|eukprot:XP_014152468.1 hypothetical protein SARC_09013 [Sphaeroforma arctica JP610]
MFLQGMITTFSALIFGGLGLSTAFAITPDVGAARQGATRIFRVIEKKSLIEPNQPGVYVSSFASRHDHGDDMGAKEVEALGPDEAVQSGLELSAVSLQHNKTAASKQEVELQGQVSFNELVFSYPSRPGQTILNGFTASIEAGKTLALVGESGCGKSSAMGILEMFYQPRGGHLSVDGVDVREYNLQSLRQAIGLVGQEPDLFTATVRENIVYGLDVDTHPVSDEEIIAACEKANAMSFIDQLEDGLSTHLGVRGSLLSGGQKQRVAIARALLRDPKILLLDEATSALDAESERVVQSALDAAAEGRTTIMIAHRLKTVENADKICVVELGKVVEEGTHSELMAVKGRYYNLVRLQTTE